MPKLNLRSKADPSALDPIAHFRLLATMLAPNESRSRERFLAHCPMPPAGVAPFSEEQLIQLIERSKRRGRQAGFLMCVLSQLYHQHGENAPTLEMAIKVIQNELPLHPAGGQRQDWMPAMAPEHMPRSGRKLREIFAEFGSVASYWAAVQIHEQNVRQQAYEKGELKSPELELPPAFRLLEIEGFPRSLSAVPRFIALAEALWSYFDKIPKMNDFTRRLRVSRWQFEIPEQLRLSNAGRPMNLPEDRLIRKRSNSK